MPGSSTLYSLLTSQCASARRSHDDADDDVQPAPDDDPDLSAGRPAAHVARIAWKGGRGTAAAPLEGRQFRRDVRGAVASSPLLVTWAATGAPALASVSFPPFCAFSGAVLNWGRCLS